MECAILHAQGTRRFLQRHLDHTTTLCPPPTCRVSGWGAFPSCNRGAQMPSMTMGSSLTLTGSCAGRRALRQDV